MAHSIINPANAVTASRYLTLPPFLYFVEMGWRDLALFTMIVCALQDKLDGLVAKLFDCKSDFGSLFDAITDAICYGFMLTVLVVYGWAPWPAVVVVLGMGAINTVLRGAYARRAGKAVNFRSFAMERMVAFYAYLVGFGAAGYAVDYFYYTCAVLVTIVVIHDAKRMLVDPVTA